MQVIFNIEWFENAKDIDTQNKEGMQRASEMYQEGYREGELCFLSAEQEEFRGYWRVTEC